MKKCRHMYERIEFEGGKWQMVKHCEMLGLMYTCVDAKDCLKREE